MRRGKEKEEGREEYCREHQSHKYSITRIQARKICMVSSLSTEDLGNNHMSKSTEIHTRCIFENQNCSPAIYDLRYKFVLTYSLISAYAFWRLSLTASSSELFPLPLAFMVISRVSPIAFQGGRGKPGEVEFLGPQGSKGNAWFSDSVGHSTQSGDFDIIYCNINLPDQVQLSALSGLQGNRLSPVRNKSLVLHDRQVQKPGREQCHSEANLALISSQGLTGSSLP